MIHLSRKLAGMIVCLLVLVTCSPVRTRYVSIRYDAPGPGQASDAGSPKITVNDFTDAREDREIIGIDYTKASDIRAIEPVGIGVSQAIGNIMQERGFSVLKISERKDPSDYASRYKATYHLTGVIEELGVTVKGKGLLNTFQSRCRIHFSLHNREGKVIWAGRMLSDSSRSSPFVTKKAIENSVNECVKFIGEALINDDKFREITGGRKGITEEMQ